MSAVDRSGGRPRWCWDGGGRLFGADGVEYHHVDDLTRREVERLLRLGELDAVEVVCGGGVRQWVGPAGATHLWLQVEPWLDDVDPWRPPRGCPGTLPYRAELWRSAEGSHVMLFTNE